LEARIDANNKKFSVLRDSLISRIDIHQVRTQFFREEMKAKMDILQEKMEAPIHSNPSELQETIKHRVDYVLSCVDQKMQDPRKEHTKKTDETGGLTGSEDVPRHADEESAGNPSRHEERPSPRAQPIAPGRGTDNGG
jgi:hypothetical protein